MSQKSHQQVTLEKQNLRKRLAYSKRLNVIVKDMGRRLQDDEDIPVQLWTEYDRLQRDPRLKQRTQEDLMLGTQGQVPGPGHYAQTKSTRGGKVQISFGGSERWCKGTITKKVADGEEDGDDKGSYTTRGKLGQKKGMRWGPEERQKLNEFM